MGTARVFPVEIEAHILPSGITRSLEADIGFRDPPVASAIHPVGCKHEDWHHRRRPNWGTLTRRLTALGDKVFVANSRGPETLSDLAAETGATAVSVPEAVRGVGSGR